MPSQTTKDVSKSRIAALNAGEPSATLVELLVIDFAKLFEHAVPAAPQEALRVLAVAQGNARASGDIDAMRELLTSVRAPAPKAWKPGTKLGITQRMVLGGALLAKYASRDIERLQAHASDTVRGWTAYALALGCEPRTTLARRLRNARISAADSHSGVREWAWLAVRPAIEDEPEAAVTLLQPWVQDGDANVRRFASEVTRPRGVWCAHIELFKQRPELAMSLLEPLRADSSRYVQNSVANWLNDASKSQPKFVESLTKRWLRESDCRETAYICRRAMRSLK
jgi:3-methyladenine DNA glycosylase AlkC